MKNIFKTSKRSIAAILTLCILLSIAGTCVYAASVTPEENTAVTEETTQELMPTITRSCPCTNHVWRGNGTTLGSSCKDCLKNGMRNEICSKCSATRSVCQSCGAVQ